MGCFEVILFLFTQCESLQRDRLPAENRGPFCRAARCPPPCPAPAPQWPLAFTSALWGPRYPALGGAAAGLPWFFLRSLPRLLHSISRPGGQAPGLPATEGGPGCRAFSYKTVGVLDKLGQPPHPSTRPPERKCPIPYFFFLQVLILTTWSRHAFFYSFLFFVYLFCSSDATCENIWYLSFPVWLRSLSTISSNLGPSSCRRW